MDPPDPIVDSNGTAESAAVVEQEIQILSGNLDAVVEDTPGDPGASALDVTADSAVVGVDFVSPLAHLPPDLFADIITDEDSSTALAEEESTEVLTHEEAIVDETTGLALDVITDARPRTVKLGLSATAVLHLGQELCPEYTTAYVRSICTAQYVLGLRTRVFIYVGNGLEAHILIRFYYHTKRHTYNAGRIWIRLGQENVRVFHHFLDGPSANKLFPDGSPNYSWLDGPTVRRDLPSVSRMTIKGPQAAIYTTLNGHFKKTFTKHGGPYTAAKDRLQSFFSQLLSSDSFIIHLSRASTDPIESRTPEWPDLTHWLHPFDGLAASSQGVATRELTTDKLVLPTWSTHVLAPEPLRQTSVYLSERHRAIATLSGVADEVRYQEMRSDIGSQSVFHAKFYALPSPWLPHKDNKSLYGHEIADNKDIVYLAVVEITPSNLDLMPAIGDECLLVTKALEVHTHPEPGRGDAEHLHTMAIDILSQFSRARMHADGDTDARYRAALRRANEARHYEEDEITELADFDQDGTWRDMFYSSIEPRFVSYLDVDLINTFQGRDLQHKTSMCVRAVVQELIDQPDETRDDHINRITAWLATRPETCGENRFPAEGITFRCRRISAPRGTVFHHCILQTTRPLQPNYPSAYRAPYLKVVFPDIGFPTSLAAFSSHAFMDTPTNPDAVASAASTGAVQCSLSIVPQLVTLNHEGVCAHLMSNLAKGSAAQAWWQWTERFGDFPDEHRHDLTKIFPGLALLPEHPHVPSDILNDLRNTKAGKIQISGVPGSGKTSLALAIARHALAGRCYRSSVRLAESSVPIKLMDDDILDEVLEGQKPGQEFMNRDRPELKEDEIAPAVHVKRAPVRFVAVAATAANASPAADDGEPVLIAFSAPSHAINNDAYNRFQDNGVNVVKVYTWAAEMANLMKPPADPRAILKMPKLMQNAAKSALVAHYNRIELEKDDPACARYDTRSLSNVALRLTPDDNVDKILIMEGREQQKALLAGYAENRPRIKEAAARLLKAALAPASVVIGTPVALRTLRNNTTFSPNLIFLEEVGRCAESLLTLPLASWPDVPTIMTGDSRQFSPDVPTKRSLLRQGPVVVWKDSYGPQREMSLMHRTQYNGAMDIYLTENHRSFGNIISWTSRMFYGGDMTIAPDNVMIEPQVNILSYFRQFSSRMRYPGAVIDVPHAFEVKVGSSWSNPTTARICVELAIDVLRSVHFISAKHFRNKCPTPTRGKVLIITPYAMQLQVLRGYLAEIGPHIVPRGWIEARTVDDSLSHEAEFVIADFPRTRALGFMDEADRLAVMSSRANYFTAYVGHVKNLSRSAQLRSLVALHQHSYALFTVPREAKSFCDACCTFGHNKSQCEMTLTCRSCNNKKSKHCGRTCRHPSIKASPLASVPLAPIDDITRNSCLQGSTVGEPV